MDTLPPYRRVDLQAAWFEGWTDFLLPIDTPLRGIPALDTSKPKGWRDAYIRGWRASFLAAGRSR